MRVLGCDGDGFDLHEQFRPADSHLDACAGRMGAEPLFYEKLTAYMLKSSK